MNDRSTTNRGFLWGAASASYQVEGAIHADGRGRSVWDVYLDDLHLAGPGISGAVAINFYDREQYLQDIELISRLGMNAYRFSISWPRIIPDGLGPVNPAGIAHYRRFIADLKAAGIRPLLTLYHWDMPAALGAAGGWSNRQSVDWFRRYAEVVFANFADEVDMFCLVNEPLIDCAFTLAARDRRGGSNTALELLPGGDNLATMLKMLNHILLAAAGAKESFRARGYRGSLGVALPLMPTLTGDGASAADVEAAQLADGVINRWVLNPMYKGSHPQDLLDFLARRGLDAGVQPGDAARIRAADFDYLGINFYAPLFVRARSGTGKAHVGEPFRPEGVPTAFNGPVRPDQFKALLDRMRTEYGNPTIYITENGAGFPDEDVLRDGKLSDPLRASYIIGHVEAMQAAIADGADVRGYFLWSSHDNLEWFSGYQGRFGLIYVDFDTQKRIPKLSAEVYGRIIRGEKIDGPLGG